MLRLLTILRRLCGYRFPRLGTVAHKTFFKFAPATVETELFPGIVLPLDFEDLIQRTTYWQGERYEYPTTQMLVAWAADNPATHFFDVGANYGFYSYLIHWRCAHLAIHAFEPNRDTCEILRTTKDRNELNRLAIHDMGLGDSEGARILHCGVADSGHSTFLENPHLADAPSRQVPVLPFDLWAERAGLTIPRQPEWIAKIDVEGFELKVLKGMQRALSATAFSGVVVEINESSPVLSGGATSVEIGDYMSHVGYRRLSPTEMSGRWRRVKTVNAFFVPDATRI